jgi:hypothetical protein
MKQIENVVSGDWQRLMDYQTASMTRVLLETRIDADDSIFVDMMNSVQRQAMNTLGQNAKANRHASSYNQKSNNNKEFRVFCTESHLEWGYFNPWDKESEKGHLFGITEPFFCISAGLTYGYQIGTKPQDLPTKAHNFLHKTVPTCNNDNNDDSNDSKDTMNIGIHSNNKTNCLERIHAGTYKYIMLRSRTPTSAGMQGVIPTHAVRNSVEWKNMQEETWNSTIERNFAVTPESIWQLRLKFKNNMEHILQDALRGQCTKAEFTCKDSTKASLQKLLAQVAENS